MRQRIFTLVAVSVSYQIVTDLGYAFTKEQAEEKAKELGLATFGASTKTSSATELLIEE